MNPRKAYIQARQQAEHRRTAALQQWRQANPTLADSDTHQAAFLAGYDNAAGPMPPTWEEVIQKSALRISEEKEQKRKRLAALPPGTCLVCEGEGEFVGSLHITKCVDCNGTGRSDRVEGGAA